MILLRLIGFLCFVEGFRSVYFVLSHNMAEGREDEYMFARENVCDIQLQRSIGENFARGLNSSLNSGLEHSGVSICFSVFRICMCGTTLSMSESRSEPKLFLYVMVSVLLETVHLLLKVIQVPYIPLIRSGDRQAQPLMLTISFFIVQSLYLSWQIPGNI